MMAERDASLLGHLDMSSYDRPDGRRQQGETSNGVIHLEEVMHEPQRTDFQQQMKADDLSESPWSCPGCTFLNQAAKLNCEMCLGTRKQEKSPYGQASELRSPYGQALNTKSPHGQASVLNAPYGQASKDKSPYGQASGEKSPYGQACSPGEPEWACQLCTFSNQPEELECAACHQRKPLHAAAMSVVKKPQGRTVEQATKLKEQTKESLTSTTPNGVPPEIEEDLEAGPSSPMQCKACSSTSATDLFCLDGCSHRFCKPCLQAGVQGQIEGLPQPGAAGLETVFEACVCPSADCKTPLTQRDLFLIAGEAQVRSHEQWLYQVLSRRYGHEETHSRCASCGEEELSKVNLSQLGSLKLRDVRRALKARGLEAGGKLPACVKRLQDAFSAEASGSSEQWICIACPESSQRMRVEDHDRQLAQCRRVFDAVAELENAFKAYVSSTAEPPASRPSKKQKASNGSGVWAGGTGYGGDSDYKHHYFHSLKAMEREPVLPPTESDAESKARKAERQADSRLEKALGTLSPTLSGGVQDGLVGSLSLPLVALVHGSGAPARVLRALLLNDSMIDVSERPALYLEALQLMRVLGAREELLPVICESPPKRSKVSAIVPDTENEKGELVPEESTVQRRATRRSSAERRKGKRKVEESEDNLVCLGSKGKVDKTAEERADDETEGTVLDTMEKLYKQASVVRMSFMGGLSDEGENEELDIGLVCEICDAFEELHRAKKGWQATRAVLKSAKGLGVADVQNEDDCAMIDRRGKRRGNPTLSAADQAKAKAREEAAYKEALKELQFRMEPLVKADGKADHYFRESKNAIDNGGVHSQKRMLAISKEIGSLVTTLPLEWGSSVHVRVDEQRMDLVKALIIGPAGTPYQNGAFLFDILLPPDYPQVPPKVQFMTTGGGKTRFNPNLYADGKVCLSILGTWAGPGWQPGKSTLMQVLLSIQGMIFVPEPYFNEPGFEVQGNKTASHNYSRSQRRNTLQLAVLGMLKHPPAVFADVVRMHFKLKRTEIEEQCKAWAAEDFAAAPAQSKKGKHKQSPKTLMGSPSDSGYHLDELLMGGASMGGLFADHESGRGSPIEATMKEVLSELSRL